MSSSNNRDQSNKKADINLLLVDAYNHSLPPYDESQSILHLILQQKSLNKLLETSGMTEIFYANDLLNRDKILPTSKQLQAARPTLASCEAMIREQARLDCQESIIKAYDDMVAKKYTGLPYALLGMKYPNLLYQIDDDNQLVTPSSGSSTGIHDGPHPDMDLFIHNHNTYFMGTMIPPLELAPLSKTPTTNTFLQQQQARKQYINTQGMQEERSDWIRDPTIPLPAHQQGRADIAFNKRLDTYNKQLTIVTNYKKTITGILIKCFSEHLLNVHVDLLKSCKYADFILTIHKQRYENLEDGVVDAMAAVNAFHIQIHLPWPDSIRQVALDLLQIEYSQQMMLHLKDIYNTTTHTLTEMLVE